MEVDGWSKDIHMPRLQMLAMRCSKAAREPSGVLAPRVLQEAGEHKRYKRCYCLGCGGEVGGVVWLGGDGEGGGGGE